MRQPRLPPPWRLRSEAVASEAGVRTIIANHTDALGRRCELHGVASSATLRFLACGTAGLWVGRMHPDGSANLLAERDLGGEVTGFFVRDAKLWVEITSLRAQPVDLAGGATATVAPSTSAPVELPAPLPNAAAAPESVFRSGRAARGRSPAACAAPLRPFASGQARACGRQRVAKRSRQRRREPRHGGRRPSGRPHRLLQRRPRAVRGERERSAAQPLGCRPRGQRLTRSCARATGSERASAQRHFRGPQRAAADSGAVRPAPLRRRLGGRFPGTAVRRARQPRRRRLPRREGRRAHEAAGALRGDPLAAGFCDCERTSSRRLA